MNLSRFSYPNLLMSLTWYLISILYILPSPVHFLYSNYTIALVFYLYTLLTEILFIIFLVYSIYLFSFNSSFHTLFIGFLSKFLDFIFISVSEIFYLHSINNKKQKLLQTPFLLYHGSNLC